MRRDIADMEETGKKILQVPMEGLTPRSPMRPTPPSDPLNAPPAHSVNRFVRLSVVPISYDEACEYVARTHRHHQPPRGHKYSIAVSDGSEIRGVVIVGRPVARMANDGWTLEVTRVATDGTRNACSMLYRAAWRAARAMGYRKLITYTLPEEGGHSLRGAGWRCVGECGGGSWSRVDRPRVDKHPTQGKLRWELASNDETNNGDHRPASPTERTKDNE